MITLECNKYVSLERCALSKFVLLWVILVCLVLLDFLNRFISCKVPALTFAHNYLIQECPSWRNMNVNISNDTCTMQHWDKCVSMFSYNKNYD